MKKTGLLVLVLFSILFLIQFASADTYRQLCLSDGQKVQYSYKDDFVCGATLCKLCVKESSSGVYSNAHPGNCNSLKCTYLSDSEEESEDEENDDSGGIPTKIENEDSKSSEDKTDSISSNSKSGNDETTKNILDFIPINKKTDSNNSETKNNLISNGVPSSSIPFLFSMLTIFELLILGGLLYYAKKKKKFRKEILDVEEKTILEKEEKPKKKKSAKTKKASKTKPKKVDALPSEQIQELEEPDEGYLNEDKMFEEDF